MTDTLDDIRERFWFIGVIGALSLNLSCRLPMLLWTFASFRAAGVLKAVVGVIAFVPALIMIFLSIETFEGVTVVRDGVVNNVRSLPKR